MVAQWLFANATEMTEDMFFDPSNDWGGLDPDHILALRAVAPSGVFTAKAAERYAKAVGDDTELHALVPALFASDLEVITKLPEAQQLLRPQLLTLVKLAYQHKIRVADGRLPVA